MSVTNSAIFTIVLDDETFVLPQGARTIDLFNSGLAKGFYKGNISKGGLSSSFVGLLEGQAYSFGDVGKPHPAIEIDARGTMIELTAIY